MDKIQARRLEHLATCKICHELLPQGIRTLVDTDEGVAEVCKNGHANAPE